ncbi:hypothetical protein CLV59_105385 [Chitinophaga dinghuensis]|uniref:Uncharacterized protein n=1 Tax=Chitinophaga dinghuensis TaxID=1539050 RepID=A0A327VZ95_9BACT|nr:hypothetical protein [Chitinophaga dinghuensis]RAJ80276.1 hypothetical protein CLV59_105385 [Chitinophaga dinghuensis]
MLHLQENFILRISFAVIRNNCIFAPRQHGGARKLTSKPLFMLFLLVVLLIKKWRQKHFRRNYLYTNQK